MTCQDGGTRLPGRKEGVPNTPREAPTRPQSRLYHIFLAVSVVGMILCLTHRAAAALPERPVSIFVQAESPLKAPQGAGTSGDPCVSVRELLTQLAMGLHVQGLFFSGIWFYSPPVRPAPEPTSPACLWPKPALNGS